MPTRPASADPCPACGRHTWHRDASSHHRRCRTCGHQQTTSSRGLGADWQRIRVYVLARDGWRCQINLPGCQGRATQVDHVVRRAEGGGLDPRLLRASCKHCNAARR